MTHEIHLLFQGDSITDAGRTHDPFDDLGTGYALIASSWLAARYPDVHLRCTNRGVSGNRITDLRQRWQADCLDLQPTIVSILIGINDTWRRYDQADPTSLATFTATYADLLTQATAHGIEIVLCEPFLLPLTDEQHHWREDLDPKIAAIRQLAQTFHTRFVPLDGLFAQAAARRIPSYWTTDGVHPTRAGHGLIAQAWLDTVIPLVTAQDHDTTTSSR